jgi:dTDP-4-dehydrorhamnose reductase
MNKVRRKIVVFGSEGQLGRALSELNIRDFDVYFFSKKEVDITNLIDTKRAISEIQPEWIINAAAYTKVDLAESNKIDAFRVNSDGVKNIATASMEVKAKMVHVSTDYVFNGESSYPYKPEDIPHPLNVYGESKLAGEKHALNIMKSNLILIRTAWIYSVAGPSFLTTIIKLLQQEDEISVVDDQFGSPTSANSLAKIIIKAICNDLSGIYHYTDAGIASWFDFASSIKQIILLKNPNLKIASIKPICSYEYKTPARRACYSVLDKKKIRKELQISDSHWQEVLADEMTPKAD